MIEFEDRQALALNIATACADGSRLQAACEIAVGDIAACSAIRPITADSERWQAAGGAAYPLSTLEP